MPAFLKKLQFSCLMASLIWWSQIRLQTKLLLQPKRPKSKQNARAVAKLQRQKQMCLTDWLWEDPASGCLWQTQTGEGRFPCCHLTNPPFPSETGISLKHIHINTNRGGPLMPYYKALFCMIKRNTLILTKITHYFRQINAYLCANLPTTTFHQKHIKYKNK